MRKIVLSLAFSAIVLSAVVRTWALNPTLPPGGNFNLGNWYLQLPTINGVLTGAAGNVDSASTAQKWGLIGTWGLDCNHADLEVRVKELCAALAEAERGGHAFIALKWFRDSFLPRKTFRWNQHPESRQAVLAEAIQRGVVLTSKIANPKTPAYPTTTIRLNRAEANIPDEAQRFHPVAVSGSSVVEVIEEERGVL